MHAVHRKARGMSKRGSTSAAAAVGDTGAQGGAGQGPGHSLPLTLAVPLVYEQLVALLAAALEAAHCVPADVVTATVVEPALVNVWWGQGTPVTPWDGIPGQESSELPSGCWSPCSGPHHELANGGNPLGSDGHQWNVAAGFLCVHLRSQRVTLGQVRTLRLSSP